MKKKKRKFRYIYRCRSAVTGRFAKMHLARKYPSTYVVHKFKIAVSS